MSYEDARRTYIETLNYLRGHGISVREKSIETMAGHEWISFQGISLRRSLGNGEKDEIKEYLKRVDESILDANSRASQGERENISRSGFLGLSEYVIRQLESGRYEITD
jgi:hypothetical protein